MSATLNASDVAPASYFHQQIYGNKYTSVVGTIPGPLLFGDILDSVCKVWQTKCDKQGSCWIYDSALMEQKFFIITLCVKMVTLTLLVIAFCLYKPPATNTQPDNNGKSLESEKESTKL